jgi:hypothetical protein
VAAGLVERGAGVGAPLRAGSGVVTLGARRVLLVDVLALVVAVLGLAVTVLALRGGSLTGRDLEGQAQAGGRAVLDTLLDAGTGAAPLTRLGEALLAHRAPLDHTAVLLLAVLCRAVLAAGVWLVLRRVFAPRAAVLVPFAAVVASPLLLPETAHVRGVLGPLAGTAATVWALAAALAWTGHGRRRDLVLLASATAIGLGFAPVAALVPLVLAGAAVTGLLGPPERWLRAAGVATGVATGVVAVAVGLSLAAGAVPPVPRLPPGASLFGTGRDLLAGLAGGPWSWLLTAEGRLAPVPAGPAGLVAGSLIAVALLAATARRPRRAVRLAPLVVVWVAGAVWLGATSGAVVALALGAALAVLPRRGESRDCAGGPWPSLAARALRELLSVAAVAGGLVLAFAAGTSLLTGAAAAKVAASTTPVRPWLGGVRASVADLPPFPRLLPRPVPARVAAGAADPLFDAPLVRLLRPDVLVHDADGPQLALDDAGGLVPAATDAVAATPPAGLCVVTAQPGRRTVTWALPARPAPAASGALARLELLVSGITRIEVSVRGTDGAVRPVLAWTADLLYQGPHTVVYPVPEGTAVAAVGVRALTPDAGLCVVSAQVVVPR